jgi:hypothetical protein
MVYNLGFPKKKKKKKKEELNERTKEPPAALWLVISRENHQNSSRVLKEPGTHNSLILNSFIGSGSWILVLSREGTGGS